MVLTYYNGKEVLDMEIKVLEDSRVLITKNGKNYLIEKDLIGGTMIYNYFVYEDIYNDLEHFLDTENEDKYFYNEFGNLETAIKDIQNSDN